MSIPPYLSRTQVPEFYPVCQRTVDDWIAHAVMPIGRVGSKPIFKRDEIEKYLDSLMVGPLPVNRRGRPSKAEVMRRASSTFSVGGR
jgi:hypothetical protein